MVALRSQHIRENNLKKNILGWPKCSSEFFCLRVCVCVCACVCVRLVTLVVSDPLLTPWTVAHQVPLFMGFSRQEYWSGLSCPPPGDLPDPGIKPVSLKSHALARGFFTTSATWRETSSKKSPRAGPQLHLALFPYPVSWKGFQIRSDQISRSVVSDSLRPQESQPARPPCPSPTPGVH